MKHLWVAFSVMIVSTMFMFFTPVETAAQWAPFGDPLLISGQNRDFGFAAVSDSAGGWVVSWRNGDSPPYSVMLARIWISPITGQLEVKSIDTGTTNRHAFRASSNSNLIALASIETLPDSDKAVVIRYYDLNLDPVGAPVELAKGSYPMLAAISLDTPAEIVVLYGLPWPNEYIRKYGLDGSPLTDPVLIFDIGGCGSRDKMWIAPDGKIIIQYTQDPYGMCISCGDGAPCSTTCMSSYPPLYWSFNPDLTTINSPVLIHNFNDLDFCYKAGMESNGDILATWTEENLGYWGLDWCSINRAKTWLQRFDSTGALIGGLISVGDTNNGDFVDGCGSFTTRPSGGFALVEWSAQGASFSYPTSPTGPMDLYIYDGSGNVVEGPVPFYDTANRRYFEGASFDKTDNKILIAWQENDDIWVRVVREAVNTLEGQGTTVSDGNADITFDEVTVGGDTTVTTSGSGPGLNPNYRLASPPVYYNIATTAEFSGQVEVCITYDDTGMNGNSEKNIRLLHFNNGWEDVTSSRDMDNNIVCGRVGSFSEFTLAVYTSPRRSSGRSGGCAMFVSMSGESSLSMFVSLLILLIPIVFIVGIRKIRIVI